MDFYPICTLSALVRVVHEDESHTHLGLCMCVLVAGGENRGPLSTGVPLPFVEALETAGSARGGWPATALLGSCRVGKGGGQAATHSGPLLPLPPGTSVMQVIASDADDPTYGSSARVVYSVLEGEQHFTVDSRTGEEGPKAGLRGGVSSAPKDTPWEEEGAHCTRKGI